MAISLAAKNQHDERLAHCRVTIDLNAPLENASAVW
jgi:hypothetical protein